MKKLLLSIALVAAAAAPSLAEGTPLYGLAFVKTGFSKNVSSYTDTYTYTQGSDEWTIINANNNNKGWDFIRMGRKNYASCAYINTNFTTSDAVTSVEVVGKLNVANSSTNIMTRAWVSCSTTAEFTDSIVADFDANQFKGAKGAEFDVTVDLPAGVTPGMYIHIGFDIASSGNNATFEISKVNYFGGATLLSPELKFPESAYSATMGEDFEAPKATSLSAGAITYRSDNELVATVDVATGEVTLVGSGTCVITADLAADGEYSKASASYTLTITDPYLILVSPLGADFEFDQTETYPWQHDATYGLKGSAYVSGKTNVADAVAYSPVIDLTKRKNITLKFMNAFNNYKVNNVMIDLADFEGYASLVVREEGATEWTELDGLTAPTAFNWNFYNNDPVSLDAYANKKIQVGFRYVSSDTCAGTWEVKEIVVRGDIDSAVEGINLDAEDAAPVYYNLQGVRVAQPEKGLYIVVKGNNSKKVIL